MAAVAYARYSSDNQRQESIEAQIRAIQEYCSRHGLSISKIYIDEAKSATTDDRPQFLQMIKDAEHGLFNALIVHKLDRFARNRYDSAFYKRKLKLSGVKIISVTEQLDDSPESVILESVLEGMAEYYSKNLAREVMKGMRETAMQCKHTGGIPPLGYDVAEDKTYKLNEREAIAIKKIFEDYISGKSYQEIINELHELGYRTKTGKLFKKNAIHSILKNEKYVGTYIFNKTKRVKNINGGQRNIIKDDEDIIRIENGMPAIITKEQFEKVQEKLKINYKYSQTFKTKEVYLLTGVLICGKCGSPMHGRKRKGGRNKSVYKTYICTQRKNEKKCDAKEVNKSYIENKVIEYLETEVFTDEKIEAIARKAYEYQTKHTGESERLIKSLEKELGVIQKQIDNIISAIAAGMFHQSMKEKMDELENKKAGLLFAIEEEKRKSSLIIDMETIRQHLSIGKDLRLKSLEEQKELIQSYVESVIYDEDFIDISLKINF